MTGIASLPSAKPPKRLPSETVSLVVGATESFAGQAVDVSLPRHPQTGEIVEIVFVRRGKSGQGLDLVLHDLGIMLSRLLQGRDPDTGAIAPAGPAP